MALAKVTMTGATKNTVKQGFTAVNQLIDDLASNENLKGASCVGIEDAAGNMAATNVEDAFAEVYDDMGTIQATSNTFSEDAATTTGLTWGYKGGLLRNTTEVVTIADGTVSLTDDTTNYIEIASDGTVYVVASAFTAGRIPIRTVVTASGVQGTSTDKRAWFATLSDLVSNTAWGPSWDSVTTIAPSKNSVYNWGIVDHNTDGTHEKLTLGSDADGDMYYRASGALARLAKGTANFKQFMNAAGTAPEWAGGVARFELSRELDADTGDITIAPGFVPSILIALGSKQSSGIWSIGISYGAAEYSLGSEGGGNVSVRGNFLLDAFESAGKTQSLVVKTLGATTTLTWTRTGVTAGGTFYYSILAIR